MYQQHKAPFINFILRTKVCDIHLDFLINKIKLTVIYFMVQNSYLIIFYKY